MNAYVFPGQGAQYPGMGKDLYDKYPLAKEMFEKANDILGYLITDIMFDGTEEDLKQTKITQPAIFLHSVIITNVMGNNFHPQMVAGHSLGEFSALTAAGALSFTDGLKLVFRRAMAMQKACEINPSTMAAILGLEAQKVEETISTVDDIVVAANYNSPLQLVISGTFRGVEKACESLESAGAKRIIQLKVGGAFHSPLMEPARDELTPAIESTSFRIPVCPVYQNVDGLPHTNPAEIKKNLVAQLTSPVKWTQTILNMTKDGAFHFSELGPGNALQGLIKKISPQVETSCFLCV